ncbi:MAG TPA: SurA N-terminal domain-containing protein [Devosia sp.]|nr:SurA N-terminal domain-containing protein [Devosia sp.]
MLNLMRRFASTLVGKIMFGVLMIGLAGFGISNVILDLGSTTIARVGSEDITTTQFQRAYRQALNNIAQQTGQMPTDQQALQMGVPGSVIGQLAANSAINQLATAYGIGVSDATLAERVRTDPNFANNLGQFDRTQFQQVLAQNGYTEAEFFDLETRQARTEQLQLGLFAGTPPSKASQELLNRYRNDTRTVEYFTLNSTSIPPIADPSEADLAKYLADHQADFRTRETRTVEVMALTPEILAAGAEYQPTEDEIKAEYERTKQSLAKDEKRDVQQVALTDPAKEQLFEQALKDGRHFLDVVAESGLKATDFGMVGKADLVDPAVGEAAFGLAHEGDFVIIPGIGGKRAIGVVKIEGGGTPTYEQAKSDIAKSLALNKAKQAYADIQDQIESLRAGLKPLKEIADRFKIPEATVKVTAGGDELKDFPGIAEADRARVAQAIFAASEGKLAPTVTISGNSNIWFDLTKVEPARDQKLDEVRDKVTAAWTSSKTDEALQAEVKAITAELDSGKSFQDVAAERSQFATVSQPITRDGDKTNVLTQQVAEQIFSKGPDSHGWAVDGDGEYLVYHVVDVTPATGEGDANVKNYLVTTGRSGLFSDFVSGLRAEDGLHINQQALGQLLNLDQSAQ